MSKSEKKDWMLRKVLEQPKLMELIQSIPEYAIDDLYDLCQAMYFKGAKQPPSLEFN